MSRLPTPRHRPRVEPAGHLRAADLEALVQESRRGGWRLLGRLVDEWDSGRNRYDQPGEVLYLARLGTAIVGTAGLNADPHAVAPRSGRLRRLYVAEACRGQGLGERLVRRVIASATGRFEHLLVRAEMPSAASFFEHLGFRPATAEPEATHQLVLPFT